MGLRDYLRKRVFSKTPEPRGKQTRGNSSDLRFVVQKHAASHLHYDFRLELDGVLKSWAVPKGISLNPSEHHLAIQTEDHPLEYISFKGKIPEGNYGAGKVEIYDHGTYEPRSSVDDNTKEIRSALRNGHLTFILHGDKLKGEFALIRNEHFAKNGWLLIKKGDQYAKPPGPYYLPDKADMDPEKALSSSPRAKMPSHIKPMLATLVDKPFDDAGWLYEVKWDGYRALAYKHSGKVSLESRNQNDFTSSYQEITAAVAKLRHDVVLDGEMVAVDSNGHPHFEWLQNWRTSPRGKLVYYVFDLLWCDGKDLRKLPLRTRRSILSNIIPKDSIIRLSDGVESKGLKYFERAAKLGLEGIVAKKFDSTYQDNVRGKNWLKIKTHMRQEVVIGGYTEPRGSRSGLGSLLVGVYEDSKFVYCGHVGTGMDDTTLQELYAKLSKIESKSMPFDTEPKSNDTVHYVKPEYVCEVKFAEWTSNGTMRQPVYLGLRPDKKPRQVVREVPTKANKPSKTKQEFELTHLDKVFWPEAKFTKGDLLRYYESVADTLLPYLKNRPQSLLRQPDGYKGQAFFQKDISKFAPDWAKTISIHSDSSNKEVEYLICNDLKTLQYLVQLGCIEINPWNSRTKHLTKPDWAVVDLDPEGISFEKVIEVAKVVHEVCEELKIPCYPKTSGKTGIHIFIPLGAKYSYDQARQFVQLLVTIIHERTSKITSLERSPAKRKHKIYLDYLQNSEGQTLASAYCVRPTKAASVSTPLHWDEVRVGLDPTKFTIKTTATRVKRVGDLWKPVLGDGVDLKQVLSNLTGITKK